MIPVKARKPFFRLLDDDRKAVSGFVNAVSSGSFEAADRYLSKALRVSCKLDYGRLKSIFSEGGEECPRYTLLRSVRFARFPDCVRPSALMFSGNKSSIVHLYTVFEPDKTSDWKICAIEREQGSP